MAAAAENLGVMASVKMSVFRGAAALRDTLLGDASVRRRQRDPLSSLDKEQLHGVTDRRSPSSPRSAAFGPHAPRLTRRQAGDPCGYRGALSLFWVEGGMRATGQPPSLIAWTALGTAVLHRRQDVVPVHARPLRVPARLGCAGPATLVPVVAFVLWRYGLGASTSWRAMAGA
jgi:hypothetical protein